MGMADATEKKDEIKDDDLGGLDDDDTGTLKLTSKAGDNTKSVSIEKKNAYISVLVKTSIENDSQATEVPLPGVEGPILLLVTEYMNHHKGVEPPIIEKPLRSKIMREVCKDSWMLNTSI